MKQLTFLTDKLFWIAIIIPIIILFIASPYIVNTKYTIIHILQLILIYPILEELVFRGLVQEILLQVPRLSVQYFGISFANIFTSLVFSLLHLQYKNMIFIPGIFISSLVFGFFFEKYKSVLPAIILHMSYNLLYVIIFSFY